MDIEVTIAVRNPDWYWSKEELKDAGEYRKEWEMLNESKVKKYQPEWKFIIPGVQNIVENEKTEYQLEYFDESTNKYEAFKLIDVSIVSFSTGKGKVDLVVSNNIIFQYLGVRKKGSKHYMYYYLSEYEPVEKLDNSLIWISKKEAEEMQTL